MTVIKLSGIVRDNMPTGTLQDFADLPIDADPKANPVEAVPVPTTAPEPPKPEELSGHLQAKTWALVKDSTYLAIAGSRSELEAGVYDTYVDNQANVYFEKKSICIDNLILFSDSISQTIIDEINVFWERLDIFKKFGFLHRRGYMMYGPAGSGKTATVQLIVANLIKRNGIVLVCERPSNLNRALSVLRKVEPNRNIICLFEDIDSIVDCYGESDLLSVLDGENQVDKVLNIATTNYPEKLDKRLVGRPRRFDRLIYVDMPNEIVRREYFKHKLAIEDAELAMWVRESDGFSFAAMTELVISVKCLGNDFNESVKTLRDLMCNTKSSRDYSNVGKVGFK